MCRAPRARLGVVGGLLRSLGGLGWFVMGDGVPGAIRSAMGNKPRRGGGADPVHLDRFAECSTGWGRKLAAPAPEGGSRGTQTQGSFFPKAFSFFSEPKRGREDPLPLCGGSPEVGGYTPIPFGSGDPPPGESPTFKGSQGGRHLRGRGKRECERPGTFRSTELIGNHRLWAESIQRFNAKLKHNSQYLHLLK